MDLLDTIPTGAGVIGLLSSDEYTASVTAFDRELLIRTGTRIGLITCADHANARSNAATARAHYARLGARLTHLDHDAPVPAGLDLLFIGGGTPTELLECLLNRPLGAHLLDRWRAGTALAGSSAGAMALSVHCLVPRPGDDKPTLWSRGLGPLSEVGLAVHATSRPEEWLEQVRATAPVPVLAIGDATGVILAPGAPPLVVGAAQAHMFGPETT